MTEQPARRSRRWLWVAVLVVALLLVPFPYLASPRWEIWVVDENQAPLSGAIVEVTYRNYSTESRQHEIRLTADHNGHVVFEAQRGWACVAQRILYTLKGLPAGPRGGGRHASAEAFGPGDLSGVASGKASLLDWHGSPDSLQSKIVVTLPHF